MYNSNNGFGGCQWIIVLILALFCCDGQGNSGCGDCGCNNNCGGCGC